MHILKPVPVILDTDMGPDCDDTGALAILHALAKQEESDILGVMQLYTSNLTKQEYALLGWRVIQL